MAKNNRTNRLYSIWQSMQRRCAGKTLKGYKNYYLSGVRVSEEWLNFETFVKDMGECPPGFSLERIDNQKGYSKENCIWIPRNLQHVNRRAPKVYFKNKRNRSGIVGVSFISTKNAWRAYYGRTTVYQGQSQEQAVFERQRQEVIHEVIKSGVFDFLCQ